MNPKRILQLIFIVLSAIFAAGSLVFAWFIVTFSTDEIIIDVGTLELDVVFFQANDDNLDGTLDGGYTEITGMPFTEILIPGQVYTFRITATNTGTVEGNLSLSIEDILMTDPLYESMITLDFLDPTTSAPVSENLTSGPYQIFDEYLMDAEEMLTFDFTLTVSTALTSSIASETITFSAFLIRLDQIAIT
ncbi:MAG: hypothetical protein K9K93_05665 [Acholeplasmataceae bacterium]|nr:hypothetical protein [Acholeplasmataceae bacterium]